MLESSRGVTKLRLRTTGVSGNQCSAMPGNIVISKTEDKNENATEDERLNNDMVITEQKEGRYIHNVHESVMKSHLVLIP